MICPPPLNLSRGRWSSWYDMHHLSSNLGRGHWSSWYDMHHLSSNLHVGRGYWSSLYDIDAPSLLNLGGGIVPLCMMLSPSLNLGGGYWSSWHDAPLPPPCFEVCYFVCHSIGYKNSKLPPPSLKILWLGCNTCISKMNCFSVLHASLVLRPKFFAQNIRNDGQATDLTKR